MGMWTLQDIPWNQFSADLVDAEMLKIVKAASLVEYNAADYEHYLNNIFEDDPEFMDVIKSWALEEIQHGEALSKWAHMADPSFAFENALRVFQAGFQLPLKAQTSVRGSLSGELVARCVIEAGTSSFYTALKDITDEPVLKAICAHIAADEFRHYKLFYTHLQRYLGRESSSRLKRLKIAFSRMMEAEDDELAMAYYAANKANSVSDSAPYVRHENAMAYLKKVYGYYNKSHVRRGTSMILKAAGFSPTGILSMIFFGSFWVLLQLKKA